MKPIHVRGATPQRPHRRLASTSIVRCSKKAISASTSSSTSSANLPRWNGPSSWSTAPQRSHMTTDPLTAPEPPILVFAEVRLECRTDRGRPQAGLHPHRRSRPRCHFRRGAFWKKYRPDRLVTNDLGKGSPEIRFDFRYAPVPTQLV